MESEMVIEFNSEGEKGLFASELCCPYNSVTISTCILHVYKMSLHFSPLNLAISHLNPLEPTLMKPL